MKKIIAVLSALCVLFSSISFAQDLSAMTDDPDIFLYYQPDGGEYYHLDQNCKRVHPKYLPLQDSFLYSELNDEAYRDLKPCEVCGAPSRQEDQSWTVSFREGDLPEEKDPADLSEGSRLIGTLVTREDLTEYTDETGVVLASFTQERPGADPEYTFGDISGLRLLCFIAQEDEGEGDRVISCVDDGISAVDFDLNEDGSSVRMDATISFVPGRDEELFFCNPVFRSASGQVFAVPGDFMAVNAETNPPGSSVGQTVRDERIHTENGRETTDTTAVSIQIEAVRDPAIIRLLQFDATHVLLKSEEFEPGAVPEQIVPLADADYLLLEIVEKDPDGGTFTRREVIGRDLDFLNTMSCRDDGICLSHYHEVLWETNVSEEAVKDTIAGNIRTYREMTDGTWTCEGYTYQYRLEIKGRMPNAAADSTFVYLSNIEEISFEQAYMAAGLSSNMDNYYSPGEAVLVDMN